MSDPIRDDKVKEVQEKLAAYFDPDEVKWKPQTVKNNRAQAISYVDARVIEDRLDDVVGVDGWQDAYTLLPTGEVECRLSVRLGGAWVTKADVGSQSEQSDGGDRMKAAYSDALKRAAVKFGVGRYLYRLPRQWVDYDAARKAFAQPPRLPDWAVPADCKPCGKGWADRLSGLVAQVAERLATDPAKITAKKLADYGAPSLAELRVRDAKALFQLLNQQVEKLAREPAPAGAR